MNKLAELSRVIGLCGITEAFGVEEVNRQLWVEFRDVGLELNNGALNYWRTLSSDYAGVAVLVPFLGDIDAAMRKVEQKIQSLKGTDLEVVYRFCQVDIGASVTIPSVQKLLMKAPIEGKRLYPKAIETKLGFAYQVPWVELAAAIEGWGENVKQDEEIEPHNARGVWLWCFTTKKVSNEGQ